MGTASSNDPLGPDAIPVRYEPPEGMTPAEMGTVLDERVDMGDITATILDLAVRGYLQIEETETTKFLFLSDTDYTSTYGLIICANCTNITYSNITLGTEGLRVYFSANVTLEHIDVTINGRPMGIYALEESFSKEMLEAHARREGPIVRFSERFWIGGR